MRITTWSLVFLGLACSGGDKDAPGDADGPTVDAPGDADTDADTDSDTDTDTDVDCVATVVSIDPPDGELQVPVDTEVVVTYDSPVLNGQWAVEVSADGYPLMGTASLASDGLSVTWTPDPELDAEAVHTVSATTCNALELSTFATLPAPVDPQFVEGNTYVLEVPDLTWAEPSDPLGLLPTFFPIEFLAAQIVTIDEIADLVDAVATTAYGDAYGTAVPECQYTVREIADFSSNPYFSLGPTTLTVDTTGQGDFADIEDFQLSARVSEDGLTLTDIRVTAKVATELLAGAQETCQAGPLVSLLVPNCVPCTSSYTGSCMEMDGTANSATVQPAVSIVDTCGL